MEEYNSELVFLMDALKNRESLVSMIAPSFPVDFSYPEIAGMLKRLGFSYVVEVAAGAADTNSQLMEHLKRYPQARYITSPCPSIVRYIRNKYPDLMQYTTKIDSPMAAAAKKVMQKYPNHKPVFIGPCIAKKAEAKEDYPELGITVITFKELKKVFDRFNIKETLEDKQAKFDLISPGTRLYAISGGLTQSAKLKEFLAEDEVLEISGFKEVEKGLNEFTINPRIRVLDILFCEGGCISGPGVFNSSLPLSERRSKITSFWSTHSNN